jgi:succinate-semialdehyde dehydrogenase/glutarate-semialdehyde dehydrogenase
VGIAVARARLAQPAWAELDVADRVAVVEAAVRLLATDPDPIVTRLSAESGRSELEVLGAEVLPACAALSRSVATAATALRPRWASVPFVFGRRARVRCRPLGVVGVVGAGEAPFLRTFRTVGGALLAGNAVVVKPALSATDAANCVEELLRRAGLPSGVLQVVWGDAETGAALVDAAVDHVAFAGSVETARVVAAACGRNLVPCSLTVVGEAPLLVGGKADLERVAAALRGGGRPRIYVVRSVAEALARTLAERAPAASPVIRRVRDEEEAAREVNDAGPARVVSVWTRDPEEAERIADLLDGAEVRINDLDGALGDAEPLATWCRTQTIVAARGTGLATADASRIKRTLRMVWGTVLRRFVG